MMRELRHCPHGDGDLRRIGRRMIVMRAETMAAYARHVEDHPTELRELYRDLLISVTSFFRDPESFAALTRLLVATLTTCAQHEQPVRVWVPGCATGEEVYTHAICLYELLQEKQLPVPLQLFGTDISELALDHARHGIYSASIEENVSPERLRRFFAKVDRGYQINKMIRESCIFARHDVTKDPPFSNLDLVSCRNLLIYLDQKAQGHVIPVFHYALKPSGLLMLGSAESTAAASDLFIPADKQHRIYARKAAAPRRPFEMSNGASPGETPPSSGVSAASSAADVQKKLDRIIQSRYSPDAVLVNDQLQILQFRGHTSAYLDPSPGAASLNLLRMAKESLVMPLRRAVQNAKTNAVVREAGIQLEIDGKLEEITLEVTGIPGPGPEDRFYFVVFVRDARPESLSSSAAASSTLPVEEHVARLEAELEEAREYLRNLKEEYEAHAEELRAANEEARSANEELQSANEELTTVNEELQSRNQELNATNSDLKNLLSSVTVPIVIVDSELRLRRFIQGRPTCSSSDRWTWADRSAMYAAVLRHSGSNKR